MHDERWHEIGKSISSLSHFPLLFLPQVLWKRRPRLESGMSCLFYADFSGRGIQINCLRTLKNEHSNTRLPLSPLLMSLQSQRRLFLPSESATLIESCPVELIADLGLYVKVADLWCLAIATSVVRGASVSTKAQNSGRYTSSDPGTVDGAAATAALPAVRRLLADAAPTVKL